MNNDENSLASYKIDWSLWEIYRVGPVIKDYESSIKKLIKIKSFQDFYELALYVPHLSPSQLFYEKETRSKARYKINIDNREELVHIDSVCMFRADIPPLQENSKNKYGGAHYYLFYDMKAYQMDQMWLSLTTSLVAEEGIAHSNIINGIRFCDRSKPKDNSVQYRLEVWMDSDLYKSAESLEAHNKSSKDIEKIIKESGLEVKVSYKPHEAQN